MPAIFQNRPVNCPVVECLVFITLLVFPVIRISCYSYYLLFVFPVIRIPCYSYSLLFVFNVIRISFVISNLVISCFVPNVSCS